MTATQIPDKFHFKIGEVSRILGVKPYVLRFWETEFRITPAKNRSQHRVYNRQEVETLLEIKQLLYEERFTIEGARVKLKERAKDRQKQLKLDLAENPYRATLRQVKKDLARIKAILK
ncbi:MAG TPA: MerR family transcriptional regulator [Patescibacteria group bacterium]|nr:MerR family transcriptional regulator [Patescibacteria group bacterium]